MGVNEQDGERERERETEKGPESKRGTTYADVFSMLKENKLQQDGSRREPAAPVVE